MVYPYANVTESEPEAILNMSPESIVLLASKAVWYKRFPLVEASIMPIQPTVPHEPVACGKVQSASEATEPLVPDAVAKVTAVRA
jgi:hypothetical protein